MSNCWQTRKCVLHAPSIIHIWLAASKVLRRRNRSKRQQQNKMCFPRNKSLSTDTLCRLRIFLGELAHHTIIPHAPTLIHCLPGWVQLCGIRSVIQDPNVYKWNSMTGRPRSLSHSLNTHSNLVGRSRAEVSRTSDFLDIKFSFSLSLSLHRSVLCMWEIKGTSGFWMRKSERSQLPNLLFFTYS